MEDEFKEAMEEIKGLYSDLNEAANMNPDIYIIPTVLWNKIMKKLGHLNDKLLRQTGLLRRHLKEKQELRRKVKELEKELSEVKKHG